MPAGPHIVGCNCHCIAYDPNCLGCASLTEIPVPLPESWVMDFPTAMSYGSARTGTVTIAEYDATGFPQVVSGGTNEKKRYFTTTWDWPDVSAFGVSTSLVIDDAPALGSSYGATVDCIWAGGSFLQYRTLTGNAYLGPSSGNPAAWHDSVCSVGADYSNASPWYYNSAVGAYIPPAWSPNRTRNSIGAADVLCSTTVSVGGGYQRIYSCAAKMYGLFAVVTVVNTGSGYDLTCSIYWWPRISYSVYSKHYFHQTSPSLDFYTLTSQNNGFCDTTWDTLAATYSLDSNNTKATVYPSATDGLSQGLILVYKTDFNCATEYDGSPVSLPLVTTIKKGGSAQTIVDAIGFVDVPATITLTPVI